MTPCLKTKHAIMRARAEAVRATAFGLPLSLGGEQAVQKMRFGMVDVPSESRSDLEQVHRLSGAADDLSRRIMEVEVELGYY